MKKYQTLRQVETSKDRAARFVENVLGDPERADEIRAEGPEDYAERKGVQIMTNPRRPHVATSKRELEEELEEANEYIEELEDKLDRISDVASEGEEEDQSPED
ncbi:MAG: hypothetical protein L0387_07955 [Acidobacteria bacterium]|nr:hypothetical protein [Acidobacteriota bacterium]MCI0718133.1 hypothetical protein [Acidobacteriota bacterium]